MALNYSGKLTVNLTQTRNLLQYEENTRFYQYLHQCNGRITVLDYRPYVGLLEEHGIEFSLVKEERELV